MNNHTAKQLIATSGKFNKNHTAERVVFVNEDGKLISLQTEEELNGRYATPRALRAVWLGDSFVDAGSDSLTGNRSALAPAWWTQCLLGNRIETIALEGVGGNTTAQMLARIDDVLDHEPTLVCLLTSGVNDNISGVAGETTRANLTAIFDACQAAGAIVICGTIPMATNITGGEITTLHQTNAWLQAQAGVRHGLIVVDVAEAVTDPTSGAWASTLTRDSGVHPNALGAYAIARKFVAALDKYVSGHTIRLDRSVNDPAELAPNPNLTGTGGGKSGTVTGDSPASTFTANVTATVSKVARTDTPGEWYRLVIASTTGSGFVTQDVSSGWAVGDTIQIAVELRSPDPSTLALTNLQVYADQRTSGGTLVSTHASTFSYSSAVPEIDGTLVAVPPPFTIAEGTAGGYLRAGIKVDGAGTIDLGLISIKKIA